jgi:asparagine N-glycosylation enzyme membrane subunit Stt3
MDKIKTTEDISKQIEDTNPKVNHEVAVKEETISKSVAEIPVTNFGKDELEVRKEQIVKFLKKKKDWIYYIILSFIVFIGMFLRSLNISKLKDITTNTWTLGPDLDPFLFLRWAEDIVENGSLMVMDMMRNVPLGFNTAGEMKLLSYMIAWLYHFLSFFSKEVTVTYAAIIFPVIMFGLTTIAFFLFARKIFYKKSKLIRNSIALIATSFFVLIPSLLPRTIAGIPEKESAAFFFMFMAFYLFLEAFTSKKLKKGLIFGVLAGISTALLALIWGGMIFVFLTIPTAFLLAFIFRKVKIKGLFIYSSWLITSFIFMIPFSTRYTLVKLIKSTSTGLAVGVLAIVVISLFLMKIKKLNEIRRKTKLPKEIFSILVSLLILFILILIAFGPSFVIGRVSHIRNNLISPMTTRFGLTVAENRQPFFINDWTGSFGPISFNIPLFFWMFIVGSVMLFSNMIKKLRSKEKIILTFGYLTFLICLIFSRYSSSSVLNGTSGLSLIVYFGGWIFFLGSFGYFYLKRYKEGDISIFKGFDFSYILYFIILTLGIIGARAGIRLIMVLGAISPIAIAFLIVRTSEIYLNKRSEVKFFIGIVLLIILIASLFTLFSYYKQDKGTAENFAPASYQIQWQKAMSWVRNNTSEDAVFAHWWDYGYWLQSIGERATILDGGNTIVYWNHLMGRHVLTGNDEQKALEFLYTHNGTHLLIDSTEIGKYTAYSSIGSDENYDRFSWISTFTMDNSQTQETNNETIYVYTGSSTIDDDILWEHEGKEIFFPKRAAGIAGFILRKSGGEILRPEVIFVYNGQQYAIPLKYMYAGTELYEFEGGLDAGIFLFTTLSEIDGRVNANPIGSALYLSGKTIHSQLARLYLFGQESDYFKLIHSEGNLVIESLREQGLEIGDFVNYQGFQGPIKIWEISYPSNIESHPEYLETDFPDEGLNLAKPGEY